MRLALLVLAGCGRVAFDPTCVGSGSAIALVQKQALLVKTNPITVPLAPVHEGDLVVVATTNIDDATTTVGSITDDAGNSYATTMATDTCTSGVTVREEIWAGRALQGGATSLSIMSTAAVGRETWVFEIAGVTHVDVINTVSNGTAGTSVQAPAVIPTSVPAAVVSMANVPSMVTSLVLGDFEPQLGLKGDDAAFAVASTPGPYGATWTIDVSGTYCAASAAFVP